MNAVPTHLLGAIIRGVGVLNPFLFFFNCILHIQVGFFDWSALKMCQPLKEFSELVLLKND